MLEQVTQRDINVSFQVKSKESNKTFRSIVWREIKKNFPGVLHSCENSPDNRLRRLDSEECTDFIVIDPAKAVMDCVETRDYKALAVRCQPTVIPWETFTIRISTPDNRTVELRKLVLKRRAGTLDNHYFVQVYYWNNKVTAIGIIKTVELIDWLDANRNVETGFNTQDGKRFAVIPWDRLGACPSLHIYRYDNE